jgi:hypothetical protein
MPKTYHLTDLSLEDMHLIETALGRTIYGKDQYGGEWDADKADRILARVIAMLEDVDGN